MKTETVIKKNKWFKESCLIEDEKQVYCRLYKQDFNSDEEADAAADLIATALNACKEINKDNPLNVAKAIPELIKSYEDLLFLAGIHESDNNLTDEWAAKIDHARDLIKSINSKQ
jgi:hypothetical protein